MIRALARHPLRVRYAVIGLTLLVCGLAVTAWGATNSWRFIGSSTYRLFPIFGLLAFSIMWSQYMAVVLLQLGKVPFSLLNRYFQMTGFLVLLAIVLHPGLLIWQLWRDGFGLPPQSYLKHFVAPGLEWVALLGTVSLLIFLFYEFRRTFEQKPWWRFVQYACDAAVLAVFYHGFRLGDQLQGTWFRKVWLVYGLCLIVALVYLRRNDFRRKKPVPPDR